MIGKINLIVLGQLVHKMSEDFSGKSPSSALEFFKKKKGQQPRLMVSWYPDPMLDVNVLMETNLFQGSRILTVFDNLRIIWIPKQYSWLEEWLVIV